MFKRTMYDDLRVMIYRNCVETAEYKIRITIFNIKSLKILL